jgi:PAS domain S-box-containing protein
MTKWLRILIVEDSIADAALLLMEFKRAGYVVRSTRVENEQEMISALKEEQWDVIIADYSLPKFSAPRALDVLKASFLDIPLIVISGVIGEKTAIETMRMGASDFVLKDHLVRLIPAVEREVAELAKRRHSKKVNEDSLWQTEERYRLMIESVSDYALFMLDPNGIIVSWNRGAERAKQYKADEVIGKHFSIFYSEEDRQAGKPEHEIEVANRVGRFEDEGWRIRKDGTKFWANVILTPMRKPDGSILGYAKITRDLTERKKANEDLQTANDGLEQKVRERTEELRNALKVRDEFLSIASHELKTPLTSFKLQNQIRMRHLIKSGGAHFTTERLRNIFRDDAKQIDRMHKLIDDMLDISRISSGQLKLEREQVNLEDLVQEQIGLFSADMELAGCNVSLTCKTPVVGFWDPYRIEQVLVNLLTNAIKYAPGKPVFPFGIMERELPNQIGNEFSCALKEPFHSTLHPVSG